MTYQPFLDMHILVSDDLFQVLIPVFHVFIVIFSFALFILLNNYFDRKERNRQY